MSDEIQNALRAVHLLGNLSPACLEQIAAFSVLRRIRAGETIFCQGEPSPYCFGLVSGEVGIQRVPRDRHLAPKLLGVLGPGAIFGESALFEESPRAAMASARQDGQLVAILGAKFRAWMRDQPALSVPLVMGMLQNTMGRLKQTSGDLSVIYGLGRLLNGGTLADQLPETLKFLQNTVEGVDAAVFFQRSVYWDEWEPLGAYPAADVYPMLPLSHSLAERVSGLTKASTLSSLDREQLFSGFPAGWQKSGVVAAVPLPDLDVSPAVLQGFLMLWRGESTQPFSHHTLLLLDSLALPFSEALGRQRRRQDATSQARLKAARSAFLS